MEKFVLALVVLFVAAAAYLSRDLLRWIRIRKQGSTEMRLQRLLNLSKGMADEILDKSEDLGDEIRACVRKTEAAGTYCSRMTFSDFTKEVCPFSDDISIQWRLDHVRPDRWHVWQEAGDSETGIDYDEWIAIGRKNFQNAGLWSRTVDGRNDEVNRGLLVDEFLPILNDNEPTSHEVIRFKGHRYLLLLYFGELWDHVTEKTAWFEENFQGRRQLQIWIDLEHHIVVKGSWVIDSKLEDGKPAHLEMHRVFTSYNEDIKVEPPPWLNVDEGGTITRTELPVVPFHR